MKSYLAIVDGEGGPGFSIVFPDLPGCVTEADTLDEAADRAREVLALYAAECAERKYPLPEPSTLDSVCASPDLRRSKSAVVMAVPLSAAYGERERVNVMLDRNLLSEIDHAAEVAGTTRSGFIERAAVERLRLARDNRTGRFREARIAPAKTRRMRRTVRRVK